MTSERRLTTALIPFVLIVTAGILAYSNTFSVPFIYDDFSTIPNAKNIRKLWPIWETVAAEHETTAAGRPVLSVTLALNYAVHGLDVRGYHVTNLVIHILAALVLYGIVRRTLLLPGLRERFGAASTLLGSAAALIWLVHPLQTMSVTYMIQRAESLMGLFYLLTLYGVVRGNSSKRAGWWHTGAVTACLLGVATKEVTATAPVVVLLYDRIFMSSSFREVFRRRWRLYVGLVATWVVLAALMLPGPRTQMTGFDLRDITPVEYAMTQCRVIVCYYLWPAIWPGRLVFDYGKPVFTSLSQVILPGMLLVGLLVATAAALRFRPRLGFLGVWFFVILGPTSSFFPITETACEYRIYLSLAAVAVLAVVGGHALVTFLVPTERTRVVAGCVLAGVVVAALGYCTYDRNRDYRSRLAIWADTVQKQPDNYRAHNNLGDSLGKAGRMEEAFAHFKESVRLVPQYEVARGNLASLYYQRGLDLHKEDKLTEAVVEYELALEMKPELFPALRNLGMVLVLQGKFPEAVQAFTEALAVKPDDAQMHGRMGACLVRLGRAAEGRRHFVEAMRLAPDDARLRHTIAFTLAGCGAPQEAIPYYREAIRLKGDWPEPLGRLAWLFATHPEARIRNGTEAVRLAKRACELTGYEVPWILDTLAAAHAETGNFAEAVRVAEGALERVSSRKQDKTAQVIRDHLVLYRSERPWRERPEPGRPFQP